MTKMMVTAELEGMRGTYCTCQREKKVMKSKKQKRRTNQKEKRKEGQTTSTS
ncbi:MAG: hypothetical protein ACI90V_012688 [Bacillariaceae sp.]|jgi:hypothetical protein